MENLARPDFLTPDEIEHACTLWRELKDTGRFIGAVEREIIEPNIARINAALGQDRSARYLAHSVESMFLDAARATPGYLWERVKDLCQICGAHVGTGVRFLHVGLCDSCARAPKH